MPSLSDLLARLPWYDDLTEAHQAELIAEVATRLAHLSGADFEEILERWETIAHRQAKWARFTLLVESGLLAPPDRAA